MRVPAHGIEPRFTDSNSVVLPLDEAGSCIATDSRRFRTPD
jgi:hypothetical protein